MRELRAALETRGDTVLGWTVSHTLLRHFRKRSMTFLLALFNQILWFLKDCDFACLPKVRSRWFNFSLFLFYFIYCICRLLEKMVNARLVYFLKPDNHLFLTVWLSPFSFHVGLPFLIGRHCLWSYFHKHNFVTVFFDWEKVYDTVWWRSIMNIFHTMSVETTFLDIFVSASVQVAPSLTLFFGKVSCKEVLCVFSLSSRGEYHWNHFGYYAWCSPTLERWDFPIPFGRIFMAVVKCRLQRTLRFVSLGRKVRFSVFCSEDGCAFLSLSWAPPGSGLLPRQPKRTLVLAPWIIIPNVTHGPWGADGATFLWFLYFCLCFLFLRDLRGSLFF